MIREQLKEGVVEQAPVEVTGREFFLTHRAVVRRNAETTKLRVVYNASERAQEKAPSLNDCLHAGPPLQNTLWSVVVRNRFHPLVVASSGWRRSSCIPPNANPRNRERCLTFPLDRGQDSQAS